MKTITSTFLSVFAVIFCMNSNLFAQWVRTNGPQGASITSLSASGAKLFAGTGGRPGVGVFLSTDNGANWESESVGLKYGYYKGDVFCLYLSGTDIYAGTDTGVFRSTDNGTSWTGWSTGLPQDCYVTAIASIGINLFATAAGGGTTKEIFLSTDRGMNWVATYNGLIGGSAWAMAVSGSNLFTGTNNGVFLSSDNGISWNEVNNGLTDTIVFALAVSGTNLFAGTIGGGIFRSTNNGSNWIVVNNGLPPNISIVAFCVSGNSIFAGTLNSGVFLSTDNGANWNNVSTGLTDTAVSALAVSDTNLFAGTKHEVWKRPLSDFGISAVSQPLPSTNSVISYPNPFSQSTSIKFFSSDHSFAQVSIQNLLGSEIARLFTGTLDAGEHSFIWDAQSMPPGMYVAMVKIGGEVREIPMMLVK